jgi:hypothetical protein
VLWAKVIRVSALTLGTDSSLGAMDSMTYVLVGITLVRCEGSACCGYLTWGTAAYLDRPHPKNCYAGQIA